MSTDEHRTPKKNRSWQSELGESSSYLGFGIQLAGSMLFYVLAGYLLDLWLDTAPWFILIGSVVGMVAFFIQLVRLSRRLSSRPPKKPAESESSEE